MRLLLYGTPQECRDATRLFRSLPLLSGPEHEFITADTRDALRLQLLDRRPHLVIVLADRAAGMEGVYLVRELCPSLPVFWFSDDAGFGMQSHRLECDYFSVKPLTVDKVCRAFQRCTRIGIRFSS